MCDTYVLCTTKITEILQNNEPFMITREINNRRELCKDKIFVHQKVRWIQYSNNIKQQWQK